MKFTLNVAVTGQVGNDAYKLASNGLPGGLALVDRVRQDFPDVKAEDIIVNDWQLTHHVKIVDQDRGVRDGVGGWNIELTEALARQSGKFESCTCAAVILTPEVFKQAVSLKINKSGLGDDKRKVIITPVVERQKIYDAWAAIGFRVEGE